MFIIFLENSKIDFILCFPFLIQIYPKEQREFIHKKSIICPGIYLERLQTESRRTLRGHLNKNTGNIFANGMFKANENHLKISLFSISQTLLLSFNGHNDLFGIPQKQ